MLFLLAFFLNFNNLKNSTINMYSFYNIDLANFKKKFWVCLAHFVGTSGQVTSIGSASRWLFSMSWHHQHFCWSFHSDHPCPSIPLINSHRWWWCMAPTRRMPMDGPKLIWWAPWQRCHPPSTSLFHQWCPPSKCSSKWTPNTPSGSWCRCRIVTKTFGNKVGLLRNTFGKKIIIYNFSDDWLPAHGPTHVLTDGPLSTNHKIQRI